VETLQGNVSTIIVMCSMIEPRASWERGRPRPQPCAWEHGHPARMR